MYVCMYVCMYVYFVQVVILKASLSYLNICVKDLKLMPLQSIRMLE
jgi:hypothetical protein